ncbi:MAG: Rrf2 family transcriptional regulator [Clostridiales bacterium]|nr:Rrf2 family transcriptional regulator [Clostridiales bacterium]
MIVSTRGRYALRVMIDLAEHQTTGYIPLKEIAERQEISEKYLESILKLLVKGKLLTGLRGKGGGYRLNQAPEHYTVWNVLTLTEDSLAPVSCLTVDAPSCVRAAECRTLPMWQKLDDMIRDYFEHITIADLMITSVSGDHYVI